MSIYILLLDFGQGYEDYSSTLMAEGFNPKVAVGAGGKHQAQTCQLMVRGESITSKLYSATENVKAQLKRDGENLFTGLIRPYISYSAEGIDIGKVSVEIIDYSELLDTYVYFKNEYADRGAMEATYENYYIFSPSNPSKSLVHALAGKCGIANITGNAVTKQISLFELPGDSYVKDVLEDLLYQHQLDYRFNADGDMEIISTKITGSTVATVTDFRNKFNHNKADSNNEGCLLTYRVRVQNKDIGEKIGETEESFSTDSIFHTALSWTEVIDEREVALSPYSALVNSKILPEGSTFEWWKLNSVKAVGTKGDAGNFSVQTTLHSWNDEKAKVSASYKGTIWLAKTNYVYVNLYGNFDFIYKATTRAGASGNNPMTYDAKYIYSLSEAQALAEALAKKQNVNRYTYSFESFQKLNPNDLVMLQEDLLLGLSAKVRILSRTEDVLTGLYKYTAEGAAESTLNPPIPEIKPLEIEYVPTGPAMKIQLSETALDLADGIDSIGASLTGYLYEYYNVDSYTWKVNGVVQSETSAFLSIPVSSLNVGQNAIECQAEHKGVQYKASAPIKITSASSEPIVVASLNVVSEPTFFTLSSRGVCKQAQLIKFNAVKTSIPAESAVSWVLYKNQQKVWEGTGSEVELTVSYNEKVSSIIAEATCEGHTSKSVIYGIRSGQPTPERVRTADYINSPIPLDVLPAITTLEDGVSELINGDYAYAQVTDDDGNVYADAVEYVNGEWKKLTVDSENFALISTALLPDALVGAIPQQSVLRLTVENIAGQAAVITKIFSSYIKLDGAIYGGAYESDGTNPTGGAGFHIDAIKGVVQATDAVLERAAINGEITGTHFNSIAISANVTDLNVSASSTYVYSAKTVETDLLDFIQNTLGISSGIFTVSGTYQGTSFSRISVSSTSVSLISSAMFSVSASTLIVYTNGRASTDYPSFSSVTSLTYNGQTFTSNQDKYKLFAMTTANKDAMHIIKTKVFTIAKGTVVCGGITLTGTDDDPISIKTVTPTGTSYSSYIFSKGGQSVTVAKDYNPLPFSISIQLFENLQGVQATNFYRGNESSSIGTANEPFAAAHISEITSNKFNGTNMQISGGIVNITGNGVLNGLKLNGEVNGNVNSSGTEYKVYGAVFN